MYRPLVILAALFVLTFAAFWPVGKLGFVSYDDTAYVQMQPMVNQGLRSAALCWAWTATHGANWHPFTSFSHTLDCSLFWKAGLRTGDENLISDRQLAEFGWRPGDDPRRRADAVKKLMESAAHDAAVPMHWENLLWHILNVLLVFGILTRLTGEEWPAAWVAAFFAIHPLHVESVAWISERKDVLSTAMWLLTILAYLHWVEKPTRGRYALVALGTALALLAKPMTVTLPCTLLLLDYWPLRRWPERKWTALVVEKIPLFLLVVVSATLTVIVQHAEGAGNFGERVTMPMRIGNAFVSYARYLGKMWWPAELSVFYPHPGWWPVWAIAGGVVLFAAFSWIAWREREGRPWLTFGWCWYIGTLVPVIGLMQVGAQSMADRYTYVPLLGIFIILAWGGAELIQRRPVFRVPLAIFSAVALALCFWRCWQQIEVWKDGWTLISHAKSIVGDHVIIRRELAKALLLARRPESEVNEQYRLGLEIDPNDAFFMTELGVSAARRKEWDEAKWRLEFARDQIPHEAGAWGNLATYHMLKGETEQALVLLKKGVELNPKLSSLHRLIGQGYAKQGRMTEARDALLAATKADRWDWRAHNDLGVVYTKLDRFSDGMAALEYAKWIHPKGEGIDTNVRNLAERMGMPVPK